ncbi:NTP transferase domain-containing protein [Thalassiella azotivora]
MRYPGQAVGTARWAAVVLAGGRSRRFGADKLAAPFGGRSLLRVALDGVLAVDPPPLAPVVVVGPARPDLPSGARFTREDPVGAGPAAAAVAGARCAPPADVVVLLPGDAPFAAEAVPALLAALAPVAHPPADAAVAVDGAGFRQHLLVAVRGALLAECTAAPGAPARRLLDGLDVVEVPVTGRGVLDVDDPAALERALAADDVPR